MLRLAHIFLAESFRALFFRCAMLPESLTGICCLMISILLQPLALPPMLILRTTPIRVNDRNVAADQLVCPVPPASSCHPKFGLRTATQMLLVHHHSSIHCTLARYQRLLPTLTSHPLASLINPLQLHPPPGRPRSSSQGLQRCWRSSVHRSVSR